MSIGDTEGTEKKLMWEIHKPRSVSKMKDEQKINYKDYLRELRSNR